MSTVERRIYHVKRLIPGAAGANTINIYHPLKVEGNYEFAEDPCLAAAFEDSAENEPVLRAALEVNRDDIRFDAGIRTPPPDPVLKTEVQSSRDNASHLTVAIELPEFELSQKLSANLDHAAGDSEPQVTAAIQMSNEPPPARFEASAAVAAVSLPRFETVVNAGMNSHVEVHLD